MAKTLSCINSQQIAAKKISKDQQPLVKFCKETLKTICERKIKGSEHLITELFFCEVFCGDSSETATFNTS